MSGQGEQKRPNLWELGAFAGALADPFVEGNSQVTPSSLAGSCALLEFVINESPRLEHWRSTPLMAHVNFLKKLASAEVDDVEKFGEFIKVFMNQLKELPVGEVIFIPGGWIGSTTLSFVVLLAEHVSANKWSVVVCNAGAGVNYHPCKVCEEDPTKVKYQTCLRIDDIDASRFLDTGLWANWHAQWLKASEFHRVEVLYDVLLPWLSGKPTLKPALEAASNRPNAEWRTAMRAGSSSGWRNLMEAVRYYLQNNYGCSLGEMKELTTTLKCEMLVLALNDMNEADRRPPNSDQRMMIEFGCRTAAHAVLKLNALDDRRAGLVNNLIAAVRAKLEEIEREEEAKKDERDGVEDDSALTFPRPFDAAKLEQDDSSFVGVRLNEADVERYAGLAEEPSSSLVSDVLQVPVQPVTTVEQAVTVLVRLEKVCRELNARSTDGSSFSSRVALQYQIAELVRSVFTEILPVPASTGPGSIWMRFPSKEMELSCLGLIHRLTMVYASAWQSFDAPTRAFDSERAVIAMCLLAIFDCVLRNDRFGLDLAQILREDGGFCVSTTVCVANISLYRLSSTMEVHQPAVAKARALCLNYFDLIQRDCKYKDLFMFRMPTDKIEIKKYGTSVLFLRKVMERFGYELVPRDNPQPPPEIESLMEWMTSPSSQLATEHPEFGMLRDMACLFKFLATMESRESELQRQRIAPSEYVSWGLTFEDTTSNNGNYRFRQSMNLGLRWEVLNYRGVDLDTADVQVTAFGDRKVYFGEGLVVHSPANISAILNHPSDSRPTEDDILHADALPTFGDTLSRQEAEMLCSYLTVPYLRIPLVLTFFATGDRVTYLFNHGLQGLLRAALFDAADWVPRHHEDKITTVPVSTPGYESSLDQVGAGRGRMAPKHPVLGTADGLLLNELRHSPEGTLRPLMKMLKSINDLAEASVYSPDAALSLYLIETALDVQAFFGDANISQERREEMHTFLTKTCRKILKKWLAEAMSENDIETSCMIHAYLCLVWSNLTPEELDTEAVTELLGSLCFVRNWHGFGLGEPSALLGYGSSLDSSDPPEQRLVRFMQAHGVDTARIGKGSLQKYLGSNRPLYLRVGAKTFRVPNLSKDSEEDSKKRLFANVPEQKLFCMLQQQRSNLVAFIEGLQRTSAQVASSLLTRIVRIALDTRGASLNTSSQELGVSSAGLWTRESRGKFLSPDQEMTLDIQGAQILWRNDELKPLPDTMTHFNDFHAIFGKQQLHCGVVAMQQNRKWVHVVGTKYDLLLWTEPDDDDQGIEAPRDVTDAVSQATGSNGADNFWPCSVCTYMNPGNVANCNMCGSPKTAPPASGSGGNNRGAAGEEEDAEAKSPSAVEYLGVRYDRKFNPFDEDSVKSFDDENEKWVLILLAGALQAHYSEKLPFKVLLPHDHIEASADTARAIAGVKTEHEVEEADSFGDSGGRMPRFGGMSMRAPPRKTMKTTWKEFVMYRERNVLHVFNLVSHGRKMYRQLVFSSDSKIAFHSLQPSSAVFGAAGDLKAILMPEQSLVITRNQDGFVETFVPSRLLYGVVPTALLEAYQFWHGTDGVIRGEPLDTESTWFGSRMIEIRKDRTVVQKPYSKRKSLGVVRSVLAGRAAAQQRRLVVGNVAESQRQSSNEEEQFDQTKVLDLCALGFTPAAARLALSKCNGNSAFAAEWLLDPSHEGQIVAADDLITENRMYKVVYHGTVYIHPSPTMDVDGGSTFLGARLGTLGYGEEVLVLERSGDWVRIEGERNASGECWVLAYHPEHGPMLEPVDDSQAMDTSEDGGGAGDRLSRVADAAKKAAEKELEAQAAAREGARGMDVDEEEEDMVNVSAKLVNLLDWPNRSDPLFRLLSILTEVEDLSHILVWADPDSAKVVLLELPRLKLRMKPKDDRLHLTDQAGWFVCEKSKRFRKLFNAHALLLMNQQREIQFLVPNHEASRPQLKGRPFNTDILCDRGSFAWLQTMDTRYYIYKVHTSGTFLISQELSASLYLTHLKMLKRQYKEAFQLAPTCTVDVPFATDESFIWGQLEKSMDDLHPDAHAVRLKLSLAIMYAREHIHLPWEVHNEYDGYLRKLPRVSACCRLSHEEEMKVCRLTSSGTPLIKNRLETLQKDNLAPVEYKAPAPRVGGSPWNKVHSQTLSYYNNHGTTLKRIHFKPQVGQANFDAFMADVVFSEHVLFDEESGVNRQLGFAFLYQLLTSADVPAAASRPRSIGEIQARYLHLKLSRWGRESVSQGEVEASNSRHMAQLAAVISQPDRPWPKLPVDPESVQLLRNGVNLYTDQGRQSNVKMWLDLVDMEFQEVWVQVVANNDNDCRFMEAFSLKDIPNGLSFPIQPAVVVDTSKSSRRVPAEIHDVLREPLASLWPTYISTVKSADALPSEKLPFDLYSHPAAQTAVAKDILMRLEEDVKGYARAQKGKMDQILRSDALDVLEKLISELEGIQEADAVFARKSIEGLEEAANKLNENPGFRHTLRAFAQLRDVIDFSLLTQALMSRDCKEELLRVNPTLKEDAMEEMLDEVVQVLVRTNRVSHANRAALLARELKSLLHSFEGSGSRSISTRSAFRAKQLARALADCLVAKRYYVDADGVFDPRFLVFEYVFDIILRERQVEIVRSFAEDIRQGKSHVQQMIMGAGKTTVVAPLLTLLLADGETLVTQVMPTALLEQTRHIMRTRFAAIITKRVFTLEFDRSCDDSVDVAKAVFAKLDEARRSRSVVCASPDAVKSLFLKFVEHIHSLESVDKDVLFPTSSVRQNKEIVQLRETMQCRSDMGDALVPIFDMWRDGVLIMDEVDVLLHPLRSELNFPIGLKDPIDMSGFRWDLPIHLLSAFFAESREEVEDDESRQVLAELEKAIERGYELHALQRNPHLVLLDDQFYRKSLMRLAAQWCARWIIQNTHDLPNVNALVEYMCVEDLEASSAAKSVEPFVAKRGDNMKLLNLGRDWIRILLPHVLAKIDRVSFGILSPVDLANIDEKRTPLSRKLMAVPFVGKDVPSRSSEFAHPDVVIGLTVLGYRYEGLRLKDVRTIVTQLKADFSRQVGPRDQRPASVLFRSWLEHAVKGVDEQLPVLPLPLFQVNDPKQLQRLYRVLRQEERVITYYLRQHVFPACMNFQSIKISACGHELGSSMLFSKRIGFSGTPSNLLPVDLGECLYEPGSDGKIMHVLSSSEVVTVEKKENWTAKSLLRDVATATPPFHALIDTGALITGMDNEQVARYLLEYLPESRFEGVVYLDRSDRKMFLQRSSGKSLHLSQCGVDPSRRFTFYDQVHTTGMDIKQAPDATAVVTIGKDMTFRDYAQGSFRMRGIGQGQTIHLYLIPEVEQLIKNELYNGSEATEVKSLDVPAWLLINSMKMEAIQYSMLSVQELYNCWRKEALESLVGDCKAHSPLIPGAPEVHSRTERLKRFLREKKGKQSDGEWLAQCITLFREPVGFEVPDEIPSQQPFHDKVKKLIEENEQFVKTEQAASLIEAVAERVKFTKNLATEELEAEIVNENEQEQQQQQEEEAEEEQEKVSRYTRDDEQANPWSISHLNAEPSCVVGEEPFYRLSSFAVRSSQPKLSFPQDMLVSDNWFRPRWIGLGDRRLKNVLVVLQWLPKTFPLRIAKLIPLIHQELMSARGMDANSAAVKALQIATSPSSEEDAALRERVCCRLPKLDASQVSTYFAAISLAEAETLRRVLHTKQHLVTSDFSLLSIEDGSMIDGTASAEVELGKVVDQKSKKTALTCLRFLNCDMHYTDEEIGLLEEAFASSRIKERVQFFEDCLRLRRREKYLWGDTPLAKLFTEHDEWHLLDARAKLQQMSSTLVRMLGSSKNTIDLLSLFSRADGDNDGALTYSEMQRLLEELRLGFSPADIAMVIKLMDKKGESKISWETFLEEFGVPLELSSVVAAESVDMDLERESARWQCSNCTYINFASDVACEVCGYGWSGMLHVPSDKWMCDPAYGGCTFFNAESNFYCEMCNKAKPSLQNVRF